MEAIEEVDHLTCLRSVFDTQGGTEADIKVRIGKARVTFLQLKNIWKFKILSLENKIRIFNTNAKTVLFNGVETWKTTVTITKGNKEDTYRPLSTAVLSKKSPWRLRA